MGFHRFKNVFAQIVLFKQIPEGQDRGLVGNSVADHVDPCKSTDGRHLDQRLFHTWIAERIPLLHQMNSQHGGQDVGRAPTLIACFRVMGLDQIDQCLPGRHCLNLSQELIAFGSLLGRGLFVISVGEAFLAAVTKLLPPITPVLACVSRPLSR